MSEPRRLWIRFRRVAVARYPAYREAVAATGVRAAEVGAHFWAFEIDGGEGRFVEFLEGPSDEALSRIDEAETPWIAAASGSSGGEGFHVVAEGVRSTEVRPAD